MIKVTLDTNILPLDNFLFGDKPLEVAIVSVTEKELENQFDQLVYKLYCLTPKEIVIVVERKT